MLHIDLTDRRVAERHTLATLTALARGAWTAVAWPAARIANALCVDESHVTHPKDVDPYGLLDDGDEAEPAAAATSPYDPSVLAALQASGKFGGV